MAASSLLGLGLSCLFVAGASGRLRDLSHRALDFRGVSDSGGQGPVGAILLFGGSYWDFLSDCADTCAHAAASFGAKNVLCLREPEAEDDILGDQRKSSEVASVWPVDAPDVLLAIQAYLDVATTMQRVIVLIFSHGTKDVLLYDSGLDGQWLRQLTKTLEDSHLHRAVVFTDACHSGILFKSALANMHESITKVSVFAGTDGDVVARPPSLAERLLWHEVQFMFRPDMPGKVRNHSAADAMGIATFRDYAKFAHNVEYASDWGRNGAYPVLGSVDASLSDFLVQPKLLKVYIHLEVDVLSVLSETVKIAALIPSELTTAGMSWGSRIHFARFWNGHNEPCGLPELYYGGGHDVEKMLPPDVPQVREVVLKLVDMWIAVRLEGTRCTCVQAESLDRLHSVIGVWAGLRPLRAAFNPAKLPMSTFQQKATAKCASGRADRVIRALAEGVEATLHSKAVLFATLSVPMVA